MSFSILFEFLGFNEKPFHRILLTADGKDAKSFFVSFAVERPRKI